MKMNQNAKQGWWILVVHCLIVALVGFNWEFDEYVSRVLNVPDVGSLGDDPPFYSMRQHFVRGISAGVAILLDIVLATFTWKRYRRWSSMVLGMGLIFFLPAVSEALIIYCRSSNLLDITKATSTWKTYDEFSWDSSILWAHAGCLLVAGVLAYAMAKRNAQDWSSPSMLSPTHEVVQ